MMFALFAILAALMLLDLGLTLIGLRRGLTETNPRALALMRRLGITAGLALHHALWLIGLALLAFLSQWAVLLLGIAEAGRSVVNNTKLLRS